MGPLTNLLSLSLVLTTVFVMRPWSQFPSFPHAAIVSFYLILVAALVAAFVFRIAFSTLGVLQGARPSCSVVSFATLDSSSRAGCIGDSTPDAHHRVSFVGCWSTVHLVSCRQSGVVATTAPALWG